MKQVDIVEVINDAVNGVIFEKWKHEGYLDGFNGEQTSFVIDGKHYLVSVKEIGQEDK